MPAAIHRLVHCTKTKHNRPKNTEKRTRKETRNRKKCKTVPNFLKWAINEGQHRHVTCLRRRAAIFMLTRGTYRCNKLYKNICMYLVIYI